MATAEFLKPRVDAKSDLSAGVLAEKVFQALASLKLTVGLLAMAVFIVLAGTMAQVEKDIWEVIDLYFRCAIAWIPLQIFFPPAFFPSKPQVPGGFWFPGGWLIGAAMAVNLVAAHGLRFKVQASGSRLWGGVGVLVLGALTTWLVVASGSSSSGVQSEGWLSWDSLWLTFKVGLTFLCGGFAAWMFRLRANERSGPPTTVIPIEHWAGMIGCVLLSIVTLWLWVKGQDAQLDASSMRILWQLIKGTIAGLVLLAGCVMVFKKRAGVVLIHGGIGLMMFSELLVGLTAVESQIALQEGERTNFARDIRNFELAIVAPSEGDQETHSVVAGPRLLKGFAAEQLDQDGKVKKEAVPGAKVNHDALPFDVQVVSYFKNADIRRLQAADKEKNPATAGIGTTWVVEEARASAGTDSDSKVDYPAAYVKLTKKGTDESLGTHLVSVMLSEEGMTDSVEVDGKKYDLSLRFTRHYKPYTVELIDVRKDDYIGTDTPRNYSSDIHLTDAQAGTDLKYHVWMNNPLRYAGETFYQSGYHKVPTTGIEGTSLALVTNTGWMIPYVACMIVAVGLLAHFTITLLRFLDRREREPLAAAVKGIVLRGPAQGAALWLPILAVAGLGLWVASKAKTPSVKPDEFDIVAFGKIPVVSDGRVKPIDTYARNTLRILSGSETFYLEDKDDPKKKTLQPATRWLLDVIARPEDGLRHKFIRIDNLDTIEALGLKNRKGFRYSPLEYMQRDDEKGKELAETRLGKAFMDAQSAREKNARELTVAERKLLDFDRKHGIFDTLSHFGRTPESDPQTPQLGLLTAFDYQMALKQAKMPLVIPPRSESDATEGKENWKPYSLAAFLEPIEEKPEHSEWATTIVGLLDRMKSAPNIEPKRLRWAQSAKEWLSSEYMIGEDGQSQSKPREANPAVVAWKKILEAYAAGDAKTFNAAVARYRESLGQRDLKEVSMGKIGFESFFNHFQPFMLSAMVYFFAFLAAVTSWLNWERTLSRTAFAMICLGLVVHTFAMVARIYISGRPPVTNLYSSAVFIGWGTVVLGMVMEIVFRNGIGNVVSAATGFGALLISHYLAGDGDTFTVLQAVLDTQFWLATHVTTINLGYATTFLAGALGVVYVLRGFFSRSLTPEIEKNLSRMIYGTLCFGIFFSFVGTVLGGLWADDSWGRFWGWDPKENGALIILLWTALVLHARWDGLVKDRGMAVLAIVGNITTSWSWFGVNELGVGLHSYGFTEGVLLALGLFVTSQLAVIVIGCLPKDSWASFRGNARAT